MRTNGIGSVRGRLFSESHAFDFFAEAVAFLRPSTAPTTAPATVPAADATPLATADAPLAMAAGAAAMPDALLVFGLGDALADFAVDADLPAGFADTAPSDLVDFEVAFGAAALVAAFGLSDFVAPVFCDAAFAGAFASFERAAMAGPAPVFASSAFDFPVFAAGAGFFIGIPRVSVASIRNAIPRRKFPMRAIRARNGGKCGETAGISG
jgi:hypothetical protein